MLTKKSYTSKADQSLKNDSAVTGIFNSDQGYILTGHEDGTVSVWRNNKILTIKKIIQLQLSTITGFNIDNSALRRRYFFTLPLDSSPQAERIIFIHDGTATGNTHQAPPNSPYFLSFDTRYTMSVHFPDHSQKSCIDMEIMKKSICLKSNNAITTITFLLDPTGTKGILLFIDNDNTLIKYHFSSQLDENIWYVININRIKDSSDAKLLAIESYQTILYANPQGNLYTLDSNFLEESFPEGELPKNNFLGQLHNGKVQKLSVLNKINNDIVLILSMGEDGDAKLSYVRRQAYKLTLETISLYCLYPHPVKAACYNIKTEELVIGKKDGCFSKIEISPFLNHYVFLKKIYSYRTLTDVVFHHKRLENNSPITAIFIIKSHVNNYIVTGHQDGTLSLCENTPQNGKQILYIVQTPHSTIRYISPVISQFWDDKNDAEISGLPNEPMGYFKVQNQKISYSSALTQSSDLLFFRNEYVIAVNFFESPVTKSIITVRVQNCPQINPIEIPYIVKTCSLVLNFDSAIGLLLLVDTDNILTKHAVCLNKPSIKKVRLGDKIIDTLSIFLSKQKKQEPSQPLPLTQISTALLVLKNCKIMLVGNQDGSLLLMSHQSTNLTQTKIAAKRLNKLHRGKIELLSVVKDETKSALIASVGQDGRVNLISINCANHKFDMTSIYVGFSITPIHSIAYNKKHNELIFGNEKGELIAIASSIKKQPPTLGEQLHIDRYIKPSNITKDCFFYHKAPSQIVEMKDGPTPRSYS